METTYAIETRNLRKLFGDISGPGLNDEPFVIFVDDLAQLLAALRYVRRTASV